MRAGTDRRALCIVSFICTVRRWNITARAQVQLRTLSAQSIRTPDSFTSPVSNAQRHLCSLIESARPGAASRPEWQVAGCLGSYPPLLGVLMSVLMTSAPPTVGVQLRVRLHVMPQCSCACSCRTAHHRLSAAAHFPDRSQQRSEAEGDMPMSMALALPTCLQRSLSAR